MSAELFPAGSVLLLARLVLAALLGGVIGWNRHRAGKPAGVGTHALVALGAALFVSAVVHVNGEAVSRVVQGIAAGIGFLGAGEIFRDASQGKVLGLTSAAAVWATAAVGVFCATGAPGVVAVATVLMLAILVLTPRVEWAITKKRREQEGRTDGVLEPPKE